MIKFLVTYNKNRTIYFDADRHATRWELLGFVVINHQTNVWLIWAQSQSLSPNCRSALYEQMKLKCASVPDDSSRTPLPVPVMFARAATWIGTRLFGHVLARRRRHSRCDVFNVMHDVFVDILVRFCGENMAVVITTEQLDFMYQNVTSGRPIRVEYPIVNALVEHRMRLAPHNYVLDYVWSFFPYDSTICLLLEQNKEENDRISSTVELFHGGGLSGDTHSWLNFGSKSSCWRWMSDSATNKHQRCRWEGHGGLVTFGLEMFLELKETQVPHFSMLSSSFWTHSETVNESGHTMVGARRWWAPPNKESPTSEKKVSSPCRTHNGANRWWVVLGMRVHLSWWWFEIGDLRSWGTTRMLSRDLIESKRFVEWKSSWIESVCRRRWVKLGIAGHENSYWTRIRNDSVECVWARTNRAEAQGSDEEADTQHLTCLFIA